MQFLSLNEQNLEFGFTTLSNQFILEYLPNTSNADYVKVYLYALMHVQAGARMEGMKDIADALGMQENEVLSAFRYWERRNLLVRLQDKPLRYEFVPILLANQQVGSNLGKQYQAVNDVLYSLFGEKRVLHGSEISMVQEWIEDLGLSLEVIMIFLQYTINLKGHNFSFQTANKDIIKLKEAGVSSIDEVEAYLSGEQEYALGAKSVLNRFRNYRNPTQDEIALYKKWRRDKKISHEDILEACKETTKGNASFAYLDGIITGLISRGDASSTIKELLEKDESETELAKQILNALGLPSAKRNITQGVKTTVQSIVESASIDLILFVCQGLALRGGKLSDLAEELNLLSKANIIDVEKAKQYYLSNSQSDALLRQVYDVLAIKREPNTADRQLLIQWKNNFSFSDEIVLKCAGFAIGKNLPIPYMNKILESWHARGLNTIEKIEEAQARHMESVGLQEKTKQSQSKRVLHQEYPQRSYVEQDYNVWQPDIVNEESV